MSDYRCCCFEPDPANIHLTKTPVFRLDVWCTARLLRLCPQIRKLYCQSSQAQPYVVDPHTPIVCLVWERVGGQCYINKNVLQQYFTRGCTRDSLTSVSLFVRMTWLLTWGLHWLGNIDYAGQQSEQFHFKSVINLENTKHQEGLL